MGNSSTQTFAQLGVSLIAQDRRVSEYRLDCNGLKILLSENHSAPVVTVMVVYRVGSRNEGAGFTGATHFLEHMMFKGTSEYNPADGRGIDDILKPLGAVYNATTWFDRTNYFECVPSQHLEPCIALEADRMRNLQLRQQDRDLEMTVVRNEFERSENEPDDVLDKEFWAAAFREHPYHWPTLGWKSDVEGVPMSKLKDFYDTFYWPNNAVVLLVGDFEPDAALTLISKYFGKHLPSPHPLPTVYTVEPPQQGERRFQVSRSGDLPRVSVGFHTPRSTDSDIYALGAMATILGGGRRSTRLYKRLVDTNLVAGVSAHQWELFDPALFEVSATVSPNIEPELIEKIILEEIEKLAKEPPTQEELSRAQKANRKSTILQSADPMVWAQMMAEAEAVADWKWMLDYDDRFDQVTINDVTRVAQKYFYKENRTIGYFIPKPSSSASDLSGEQPAAEDMPGAEDMHAAEDMPGANDVRGAKMHGVTAESSTLIETAGEAVPSARSTVRIDSHAQVVRQGPRKVSFAENVQRHVLSNGLTVLAMENTGPDLIAISGNIKAGGYFTSADRRVLAPLTYQMLTRGSSKYSKTQLGEILEEMGASLGFAGDYFTVSFGSAVVNEDFGQILDIVANVLRQPLWLDDELAKTKKEFVSYYMQEMNDTTTMAKARLCQALYKADSPYYAAPFEELIEQLERIDAKQLRQFHAEHYGPDGTILSIVGNVSSDRIIELVESKFGDWSGPAPSPIIVETPQLPDKAQTIEIFMPEKANVDIRIGLPCSLKRAAPEYHAARLANAALGQDTLSSRLGLEIRERNGLTYGIHSRFDDLAFGGAPWSIDLSTNPEYVDKALKLVDKVVRDYVAQGITPEELAAEAGRATGNFQLALRTSLGIAGALTQHEFLGLGFSAIDSFPDDINAVSKKQVDEAIDKYFKFDQAVTTMAGTLVSSSGQ